MPRIIIEESVCKGCGLCVHFCPRQTIVTSDKVNPIGYYAAQFSDSDRCTGCGLCAVMCPEIAIKVYR